MLSGFNAAYNSRRQRVLDGLSPEMVLRQRLKDDPASANPRYRPPKRGLLRKALRVVADAKEVSHPDTHPDTLEYRGAVGMSPSLQLAHLGLSCASCSLDDGQQQTGI